MAVVPHRAEAASRVAGSEMPGSQILVPEVSMMMRAPSGPHRLRSWASPWATVMIWMPLPPESASHDATGTGQIWGASSRVVLGFGVSQGWDRRPRHGDGARDG